MNLSHVFIYFLLFIPSTYCGLIPNNRIITDPDSTNDFNLVEGITYKIVHLRSSLNLDGNDDGIYANSVYSPWILRKASDQYNIMNVKSGLNLDSNGQRVYISSPKDNSIYNPYQNWRFTRIKDNIYNIVHINSGLNLDSNGKDVYISSPEDHSTDNIYQHWLFEPINYNLTAVVMDMKYPPDLKERLEQYKSRTNLLSGTHIIDNHANAKLEETIDRTELKYNSYTVEVKKSKSFEFTEDTVVSFNIGRSIFGLLGINTGFTNGIHRKFGSRTERIYSESVTEAVSYHVLQKITVLPFNSVRVVSTVDKVDVSVPFQAKIRISGKGDRLDENGLVVSMTDVEINALRCYLSKENYEIKNITVEENSLVIDTVGTLKVTGYGLETEIKAIPIPHRPKSPESPKDPEPPKDPNSPESPNNPEYPNNPVSPNPASSNNFSISFYLHTLLFMFIIVILYKLHCLDMLNKKRQPIYLDPNC